MRILHSTNKSQNQNSNQKQNNSILFLNKNQSIIPTNSSQIKQCNELISKIIENNSSILPIFKQISLKIQQNQYYNGIGFYNAKNLVLLRYSILLEFYELFKSYGQKFTQGQGLKIYQELVFMKILLMKLGSVQKKLNYQTNKLLKIQSKVNVKAQSAYKEKINQLQQRIQQNNINSQISQQQDVLNYQPRIEKLVINDKIKLNKKLNEKYIPPKISAVLTKDDQNKKKLQRQKSRKKAYLLRKFKDDLLEQNEQVEQRRFQDGASQKLRSKFEQKTRLQEESFTRFRQTKKQKSWRKQLMKNYERPNQLNNDFNEIEMMKQLFEQEQQQNNITVYKNQNKNKKIKNLSKKKQKF